MAFAPDALSEKEAEIYDRQIRLWGVDAQKRMRSARVLVLGLGALGAEIVKNLVLAGINLTLADEELVTEADLGTNFFLTASDVGTTRSAACLPRVREMNTLVSVEALAKTAGSVSDADLAGLRLVIHCGGCPAEQLALANRCRALSVPIAVANLYGFWGAFALDFGKHAFTREIIKSHRVVDFRWDLIAEICRGGDSGDASAPTIVSSMIDYPSIRDVLTSPWSTISPTKRERAAAFYAWAAATASTAGLAPTSASAGSAHAAADPSHGTKTALEAATEFAKVASAAAGKELASVHPVALEAFCSQAGVEFVPVAAVVAGQLGQEVVKLLSGKDEPLQHVFIFDAMEGGGGAVFRVGS